MYFSICNIRSADALWNNHDRCSLIYSNMNSIRSIFSISELPELQMDDFQTFLLHIWSNEAVCCEMISEAVDIPKRCCLDISIISPMYLIFVNVCTFQHVITSLNNEWPEQINQISLLPNLMWWRINQSIKLLSNWKYNLMPRIFPQIINILTFLLAI